MKYCTNCGKALSDNSKFCTECGKMCECQVMAHTACIEEDIGEENEFLKSTNTFLKVELIMWLVGAIVTLVYTALFGILALMFLYAASQSVGNDYDGFSTFAGMCIVYTLVFLPLPIINFIMFAKTRRYRNILHTDILAVEKRCTSVGMLIFEVFFNNLAFIFLLINFIRMKSNKKVIDRIVYKQTNSNI